MSELRHELAAETYEEFVDRLFTWTRGLAAKWRTKGLSEQDARDLLDMWADVKVSTASERFERVLAAAERTERLNGLLWASAKYHKDPRTIRRWCERGYFPSAYRTEGGHWRIPISATDEAQSRLPPGFARKPKSIFRSKLWREFKDEMRNVFYTIPILACETEAALRNMAQTEIESAAREKSSDLKPSNEAFGVLDRAHSRGKLDFARLCATARRVYLNNPPERLTPRILARALRIGTATLYRRYTAAEIQAAIRAATRPLDPDNQDAPKADNEEAAIKELFGDIELEYQPTAHFTGWPPDRR